MSSILSTLLMSAGAMNAFDKALQVTQNNVANASTPGYASQIQTLIAQDFSPQAGASGGVIAGAVQSSRDDFAEQAVRRQAGLLGEANQNVDSFTSLQSNFDISGDAGLPNALNNLFQAFSAWGQTPNDGNARQAVIDQAGSVAEAFQQTASGLTAVTQDTDLQLRQTVDQVNQLVGQLAQFNSQVMRGDHNDAGLDAQVHSDLEQLSSYVPFTATMQTDGSVTILINGQTPVLIGARQYKIALNLQQSPDATYPKGPPLAEIQASDGTDITSGITSGKLGALLNTRNQVLPTYIGSSDQAGALNTMAKQFADRVNQLLESGTQADGTAGLPLFTYASQNAGSTQDDTSAAQTIAVNPAMTRDQLAASLTGPPVQSNGVPLTLSQLADPQNSADEINGESFTAFYGDMTTRIGNALSKATNEQSVAQSAVAQAQNLRQQASGVDLNVEAMKAIEFERAYEANARLVTVLDQLTQDTIQMLPTS
jgi:flagellar hook-associated protein 1 FlgK